MFSVRWHFVTASLALALHQELNSGRIEEKKSAESLKAKAREKLFTNLKGSKYILLKRKENLKEEQKEKLDALKKASAMLAVMHELKEEFTALFDRSNNLGEGTLKLTEWMLKAQAFFPKFVRTLKKWFVEVIGYFEQKTTNAVVEGINNRLKVLKRCGFGCAKF